MTKYIVTGHPGNSSVAPYNLITNLMGVGQTIDLTLSSADEATLSASGLLMRWPGPSAVTRSWEQFNVLDSAFGAKGDGAADDTAAIQSAVTTANAAGGGMVVLPSGYTFLVSTLVPASNVTISAYGAMIKQAASQTFGIFYSLPGTVGTSPVSNFRVLGGTVVGTGSEATNNNFVFIAQGTDVEVSDTKVSGFATGPIYFRDCQRVRVMRNTQINCCTAGGSNGFNVVQSVNNNTTPLEDCLIEGNIISGCATIPIDIPAANGATAPTAPTKVVIRGNNVQSTGSYGIGIELGGTGAPATSIKRLIIEGNIVETTGGSTANAGIHVTNNSSTASTDVNGMADVVIHGNQITSQGDGIFCQASRALIFGNRIQAAGHTVFCKGHGTITATGSTSSGTNTITTVTGDTGVITGAQISGGGINSGTYIKSGVGSGTWTVNKNSGGTTSGEAITVSQPVEHLLIANNLLHVPANPLNPMITLQLVNRATVCGNRIFTDGSNSANTQQGMLIVSSGWVNVQDNDWQFTPGHGVDIQASHDCLVAGNKVRNVGDGGTNSTGINVQSSADLVMVAGNAVVDDRASSQTTNAVNAAGTNGRVRDNTLLGWATAAVAGSPIQKTGNTYTAGSPSGKAVLVAGTVTVSTAEVQTGDTILLSNVLAGGTLGILSVGTIVNGTSFVINSSNASDTSTVFWRIDH